MKWQQLAHTVDTFYCKSMSKSSKIHFCVLFKVRRLHLEFYVKKKNAANVLLEFCLILVSNPLPLLPSIIVCNRCYWSCLGILWDLRWGLFLPNTIMLINSCFGDLRPPDPLWSARPILTERPLSCQVGRRIGRIICPLEGNCRGG